MLQSSFSKTVEKITNEADRQLCLGLDVRTLATQGLDLTNFCGNQLVRRKDGRRSLTGRGIGGGFVRGVVLGANREDSLIRIAMVKTPSNELRVKAFCAQDFEDAEQAAKDWIATIIGNGDDIKIVNFDYVSPVIEYFVEHYFETVNVPVVFSRVLSDEDIAFLVACGINMEELLMPCCGMGQHPNAVSPDDAIKKFEKLREEEES